MLNTNFRTENQSKSFATMCTLIHSAENGSKGSIGFTHPSGKFYTLTVSKSSEDFEYSITKVWGKGGVKHTQELDYQSNADIRKVVLDRLNHGYSIVEPSTRQVAIAI